MSADPMIGIIITIVFSVLFFPWYFGSVEPWLLGLPVAAIVSIYMIIVMMTVIGAIMLWHWFNKGSKKVL